MLNAAEISEKLRAYFSGTDKFLVEVLVKPGNRVFVFIDGDLGVTIEDCVKASRYLESILNRESEDFELNVSSAGADHPIVIPRQYSKNIGRAMRIKLQDDKELKGRLIAADDKGITIETESDHKKKPAVTQIFLEHNNIKEAKVIISFK